MVSFVGYDYGRSIAASVIPCIHRVVTGNSYGVICYHVYDHDYVMQLILVSLR